jgi:hypothetical protein
MVKDTEYLASIWEYRKTKNEELNTACLPAKAGISNTDQGTPNPDGYPMAIGIERTPTPTPPIN